MKKLVSLLVAFALVLTAVCAFAEAAEDVETLIYLSAGIVDEEGNVTEMPEGMMITLTLHSDYTFSMDLGGQGGTGTWTEGEEEGTFCLIDDQENVAEGYLLTEDGTIAIQLGDQVVAFVLAPEDYFID